ncbi:MAG: hypothetical protein OEZ23_08880, partial [Gammaproteobacteria bacterium]|nr:hypothetical protein [Gammaproteobacteria bacterium]
MTMCLFPLTLSANECPEIPPVPVATEADRQFALEWKGVAKPYSVFEWMGGAELAPLGTGHLALVNPSANYYDWAKKVSLPLWNAPGKAFYGWLHSALILPLDQPAAAALTGAGMVETDLDHYNLVALQQLETGWIQIQLLPGRNGAKWTHRCHLGLGESALRYQSWDAFLIKQGGWLKLRTGIGDNLLQEPTESAQSAGMLSPDEVFSLVAMKDDWILIQVRPCRESEIETGKQAISGWIKWSAPFLGPRVWPAQGQCQ